ncbi:heavy-metal-associated domain-containing protein [Nostocoides sp. Soil756]|jgi:copper chaperone CopZ|uniref:heavy-metal-associated domain-containing protein n=1 Tax=Nostocoides sp. Soil756 TaxID=1736399 RepID=UPI0006F553A4|nr:heavy-metal-associated domain-containing protein [Tetrasphaera sp. Soil756]KRE60654.1 heavy metal transporter [Tetrasphaera sp. Soil756]
MATTQQFHATGLTCGHCAAAVTEELTALGGVSDVAVEVVADGTSTVSVTADRPLTDPEVAAALDEAGGYALVRA